MVVLMVFGTPSHVDGESMEDGCREEIVKFGDLFGDVGGGHSG